MNIMKKLPKLILCSALAMAGAAQASLVQNGATVSDTVTHLDWMTLSSTTGYTYNQMLANFSDKNSAYYGYQYASLGQVETLFSGQGYTGDFATEVSDAPSQMAVRTIFDLFGQTGGTCCARGDGMLLNADGGPVGWLFYVPQAGANESLVRVMEDSIDPDGQYWDAADRNAMGSWIVKQADAPSNVPEPGTLVLMSLAIGVLALIRGKRR